MADDSPDRWRKILSLFDEAANLPSEERAGFLDSACGADADLRTQVEELLASADRAGDFLEKPFVSEAGAFVRQATGDLSASLDSPGAPGPSEAPTATFSTGGAPAEAIGPYRLLQKIGEGGMGEVWLAEQTEPVRRKVALKLVKAGMDSKQVIARFEAERQALALMDHPAIAKVFDAGETPRGLPYFAMEYVKGEPITSYCDRHRLSTAERLTLFAQVCDGVQHAHQKGVIHRDLKPSNVLVEVVGEKPYPKIIDFGVAKATAQRLTEKTMFTELGVLIGTPEYMSPEQAEMTGLDIDTRTDVYALGVMLYELLTGALPFESKELRQAGYDEIRRRIREVDPPRPSTRVSSMGAKATDAARNRRTEPRQLAGRLRGDLDWIVMKTLEKDRTRRYGSPSELAADLGRHLKHEPVLAGPPSALYRAQKFVRRHRFGVAAAALAVLALAGFGVAMAVQARTIARERDRAERVSEFLVDLFKVSDPSEARGNSVTAREVLDRGADTITKALANEPLVQAQMMLTMGRVYVNLGLAKKAEPLFSRAADLRERLLGPRHRDTLMARRMVTWAWDLLGRWKEAEGALVRLLETDRRILGNEDPETLAAMTRLGSIYERLRRPKDAGLLYREAYAGQRRVLGEDHPDTLWSLNNLASNLEDTGKLEESTRLFHEVTMARARVLGPDHPDAIQALTNEARLLSKTGHSVEAERLLKQSIEGKTRVLGKEHPSTLVSKSELIDVLVSLKRYDEAVALYKEVLSVRLRVSGAESPAVLSLNEGMGVFYLTMGMPDEAEKLLRETYATAVRARGAQDTFATGSAYNLAALAALRGRIKEALSWVETALSGDSEYAEDLANDPDFESLRNNPDFERLLAAARAKSGKPDEAAPR